MKTKTHIILELGHSCLSESIIKKIVNDYLIMYTSDWVLERTCCGWQVIVSDDIHLLTSAIEEIEKEIIKELKRLRQLDYDIKILTGEK